MSSLPVAAGGLAAVVSGRTAEMQKSIKRNRIFDLENAMFEMTDKHIELPVEHIFTPGMYCRQIFMPAGATVTSKIHKTEHVYIISKGRVIVATDEGSVELEAPHTGVTKPGTKRALYIVEDTIWTTMHPTELTDVDEIEKQIIAPTYKDYLLEVEQAKLLEKLT